MNKFLIISITFFLNTYFSFSQNKTPPYDICVTTNVKDLNSERINTYKVFSSDTNNLLNKTRIELFVFKNNKVKNNWSSLPLHEVDHALIVRIFQSRFLGGFFDLRTYNRKGFGIYSEAFNNGKVLYQYFHKRGEGLKKREYIKNDNSQSSRSWHLFRGTFSEPKNE